MCFYWKDKITCDIPYSAHVTFMRIYYYIFYCVVCCSHSNGRWRYTYLRWDNLVCGFWPEWNSRYHRFVPHLTVPSQLPVLHFFSLPHTQREDTFAKRFNQSLLQSNHGHHTSCTEHHWGWRSNLPVPPLWSTTAEHAASPGQSPWRSRWSSRIR